MRAPLRPRELLVIGLVCVFGLAASGTHVVASGETLGEIARRHGTTVSALVQANALRDPDVILVGQTLTIPGAAAESGATDPPAAPATATTTTTTYVVAPGETLSEIAAAHHTTVAAIVEANHLDDPDRIVAGRRLDITGAAPAVAPSSDTPSAAAPAAQPTAPPVDGPQLPGQRHTVSIGDTIAGIARRYGVREADFVRWNGLVDGKIYATTRLLLYNPGDLPTTTASSGPRTHRVAPGETLGGIAGHYGVSADAIVAASGLSDPNLVVVGQSLTIPGGTAGFACPVSGGSFFNDWAFPRSGGRSHAGTDIFAPRGTPVRAPAGGLVEIATGTIGGHQFRLTMADGTRWYGTHMDRFGATGQVQAGDVIGYVGDSGNALGGRPHLHFEIHPRGGDAANPYPLLREVC